MPVKPEGFMAERYDTCGTQSGDSGRSWVSLASGIIGTKFGPLDASTSRRPASWSAQAKAEAGKSVVS
jgi:hypothetical protein